MASVDVVFFGVAGRVVSLLFLYFLVELGVVIAVDCLEFFGYQRKTVRPLVRILAVVVFVLASIALFSGGL